MTTLKKAAKVAKGFNPSDEILTTVFKLYVNTFKMFGFSYDDAVEAESCKMADEIQSLVDAHLNRIKELTKDKKSSVCVYRKALAAIMTGKISVEKFIGLKNTIDVIYE